MPYLSIVNTVLRSAVSKPATRLYPFVKRAPYKNTRGSISIDINACIFCGLCQRKCPSQAIEVTKTDKAWQIDRLRCIQCGACVDACPKKCLTMENAYSPSVTKKGVDIFKQDAKAQPEAEAKPTAS
jgi:ech hydrogenase subunit F